MSFLSGWATAVVATDLIAGWWRTDRLFCLAVGFLTLLFATTTVSGVILLLRQRDLGRWLIVFGAGVALLTFGSVFLAGARIAGGVRNAGGGRRRQRVAPRRRRTPAASDGSA